MRFSLSLLGTILMGALACAPVARAANDADGGRGTQLPRPQGQPSLPRKRALPPPPTVREVALPACQVPGVPDRPTSLGALGVTLRRVVPPPWPRAFAEIHLTFYNAGRLPLDLTRVMLGASDPHGAPLATGDGWLDARGQALTTLAPGTLADAVGQVELPREGRGDAGYRELNLGRLWVVFEGCAARFDQPQS